MNTKEKDRLYIAGTYNRYPVEIVGGSGSLLKDDNNNEYIDLGSGVAVNIFGMNDKEWISAVTRQLSVFSHMSNLYYSKPGAELAEILCTRTGMKKVFFSNSGAEANECAIKACRKYAAEKHGRDTYKIITLVNSFHGRSVTTLAATGQEAYHRDFTPLTEGFLYCPAGDTETLYKLVSENKIAGIMFELIQGEGGVNPLDSEFVSAIAQISRDKDILMIDDEVQTGNGRTGALYAYMKYGIAPDIITTAKGLGGGLPIGVTLLGNKTENVFTPGTHGSTFGGNPTAAAGAINIINRIDDKLLAGVEKRSKIIFEMLTGAPGIKSVVGMGLMIGIETEKPAIDIVHRCINNGVLILTAKTKLRLLPALNIPEELLIKALSVIKNACACE